VAILLQVESGYAQFSPGELSRPHQQLEGIERCAQCHEVGREISGVKCLTCHAEIKTMIEAKRGFHYLVSSKNCVACHKEHLGRDARTVLFSSDRFDHSQTGYALTGKHASTRCDNCHATKNISAPLVREIVSRTNRKTYLGLSSTCISCHEDRHRGAAGTECQSCHTTTAWLPASAFDHSRTKYPLTGKHISVPCAKCHGEYAVGNKEPPPILPIRSFADCMPCHGSPHKEKFASQLCNSCHSTDGWLMKPGEKFDHKLTGFVLAGKHASLQCQQCHKSKEEKSFSSTFRLRHSRCTDCHRDYHEGEFQKNYGGDCAKCHTEQSFQSSTFSWLQHKRSRFALDGAHGAVPCLGCHKKSSNSRMMFHFASLRCESCHKDAHGGQFSEVMAEQSCGRCHSTSEWRLRKFDHSMTRFVLAGKHALAECESCHKPKIFNGVSVIQYRGTETDCQSCHTDAHAGQFAHEGKTRCIACHTAEGWRSLVFDHNTQSVFTLTGGHRKVECRACHHQEQIAGEKIRRFKPLSAQCESCHAKGGDGNG